MEPEAAIVVASGKEPVDEKEDVAEEKEALEEKEEGKEELDAEDRELADGMYFVEEIRGKKTVKGVPHYLVKWKNWDEAHNTWEPVQNMQACIDYVHEYEDRMKRKKKRKRGRTRATSRKKKAVDTGAAQSASIGVSSHESDLDDEATPASDFDGLRSPEVSVDTAAEIAKPDVVNQPLKEKETGVPMEDIYPSKRPWEEVEEAKSPAVVVMLNGGSQEEQVTGAPADPVVVSNSQGPVNENNEREKEKEKEKESRGEDEERTTPSVATSEADAGTSGRRKRKPAVVRRVSQGPENQPHMLEEVVSLGIGLKSPQPSGSALQDFNVSYPGSNITRKAFSSPERVVQRGGASSSTIPFVKILKPLSYSNSTRNDRQEVTVLFSVLRSDEKEVVVDNKFLRQQYPQLLIDFYEQHLRYTSK